jgi:hypothetical protein
MPKQILMTIQKKSPDKLDFADLRAIPCSGIWSHSVKQNVPGDFMALEII